MANYYVKNGGSNALDGLSDGNAWETISKVNGFSFASGDTISFKRGSYWRETLTMPRSGTSGGYMIFNSYSTGNNPKILGSNTTTWTNYGGNVWVSASTFTDPNSLGYGCEIWFENTDETVSWGVRKAAIVNLATEYDYTWVSNYIYVYAATDPDTRYTSVEIPQRRNCISLNSKDYIKIDYIDLHYAEAGVCGEYPVVGHTGLYVGHAEMSYFGIKTGDGPGYSINTCYNTSLFEYNTIHDCGRRGISHYLYGDANISNIIVQYNEFYHNYHTTGFDCRAGSQSTDDGDLSNITIRNNLIWEDEDNDGPSTEWIWLQGKGGDGGTGILSDIYIYNNIMKFSNNHGIGIAGAKNVYVYNNTFYGHCTEVFANTFHITIGQSDGGGEIPTGIIIKNNIFYSLLDYDTNGSGILISLSTGGEWANVVADYNIYYRIMGRIIAGSGSGGDDEYYMDDYALLRTEHPTWEEHGYFDNPDLVSSTDYHLQETSPGKWTGVYLADVLIDYEGNPRHNPPSLGAYEFGSSSCPVITNMNPMIHSIHVNS